MIFNLICVVALLIIARSLTYCDGASALRVPCPSAEPSDHFSTVVPVHGVCYYICSFRDHRNNSLKANISINQMTCQTNFNITLLPRYIAITRFTHDPQTYKIVEGPERIYILYKFLLMFYIRELALKHFANKLMVHGIVS